MVIASIDLNWSVVKQAGLRVRELKTERSGSASKHLSSNINIPIWHSGNKINPSICKQ